MESYTVLVTGGNGFLGQHVVKLLQEVEWVTNIRVLDIRPFSQKLDYIVRKPVDSLHGSITDKSSLDKATKGVNCVIHLAGLVFVSAFPDEERLQLVNVGGTKMLLDACAEHDVEHFVYCSSQSVVVGHEDIVDGTEDLQKPPKLLFGKYAETKCQAEEIVANRNNTSLRNGKKLKTLILRPVPMYGELDPHYVFSVLKKTKQSGGTLVRFGRPSSINQFVYVGNVAWAFICAMRSLNFNNVSGGEAFFVSDDTHVTNMFDHCLPYLESHGMKVSSFALPFWFIYILVLIWTMFIRLTSFFMKVDTQFTYTSVKSINMRLSVVYTKAYKLLSYTPLFNADESRTRSLQYYSQLTLD